MKRFVTVLAVGLTAAALAVVSVPQAMAATSAVTAPVGVATVAPVPTITVRGVVTAGVEAGCKLLRPFTATGSLGGSGYLLIGGDPAVLKIDARVEVVGQLKPGTISYCMQGTPLVVISARRL